MGAVSTMDYIYFICDCNYNSSNKIKKEKNMNKINNRNETMIKKSYYDCSNCKHFNKGEDKKCWECLLDIFSTLPPLHWEKNN